VSLLPTAAGDRRTTARVVLGVEVQGAALGLVRSTVSVHIIDFAETLLGAAASEEAVIGDVIELVQAGLGISIIPKNTKLNFDDIVKVQFSSPYLYRHIYMVWNSDCTLSPAAKAFRKYILSLN